MKAIIFSNLDIIGTTDLEVGDFSMGGVFGTFYPNENYYNKVQKHTWNFNSSNINFEQWNSLKFNIQLENGMFLLPHAITFDDVEELKDEPKRVDLAGVDTKIIEDFIISNPQRTFVVEPWKPITIDQKLSYETELKKETFMLSSSWNIFKSKKQKHILSDVDISAFCKDSTADNILFEIRSKSFDKKFALVHLTWSGKLEGEKFPITKLFSDYDEFKNLRMYPDKIEWEN